MKMILLALICCLSSIIFAQGKEENVFLNERDSSNKLAGTYVLPVSKEKINLVIIQAGSGPTDRNGNSPMGIKANSYRLLANELAAKNIAVLLTDKRGIAASAGAMKRESDLRFNDYANDLADWIKFARKDKRFRKIYIAGHSEGSLISMLAAQRQKVDGYISIAGAGENIDRILLQQIKKQLPRLAAPLDSMLQRLKNNQPLDSVPPMLASLLRPSVQPYMASWMKYDPCAEIKKLKVRVLIIQGTTDIQVDSIQSELLHQCAPAASYHLISGMNHVLKQSSADRAANLKTYGDPTLPLMPGLADIIGNFVRERSPR